MCRKQEQKVEVGSRDCVFLVEPTGKPAVYVCGLSWVVCGYLRAKGATAGTLTWSARGRIPPRNSSSRNSSSSPRRLVGIVQEPSHHFSAFGFCIQLFSPTFLCSPSAPRSPRNEASSLPCFFFCFFLAKGARSTVASHPTLSWPDAAKQHARKHDSPLVEWRFHQALILAPLQAMDTPVPVSAII
jgi:hypothetical protein